MNRRAFLNNIHYIYIYPRQQHIFFQFRRDIPQCVSYYSWHVLLDGRKRGRNPLTFIIRSYKITENISQVQQSLYGVYENFLLNRSFDLISLWH